MKLKSTLYWGATLLLSFMMLGSAGMYFFNYPAVKLEFTGLGFPTYIVYYIACAKILAVLVILNNRMKKLVEWAYAGLFFEFILATLAHVYHRDAEHIVPIVAILFLLISYCYKDHVRT